MSVNIQTDALNKLLELGDEVVYSDSGSETSRLLSGRVIGFTDKKVRLEINNEIWRIKAGQSTVRNILKFPEQIAKVN